jgi:hypothetical protein
LENYPVVLEKFLNEKKDFLKIINEFVLEKNNITDE